MNKTYKFISGLFLLSVLFTSCTSEEESNELNALEKELSMDHKGTLTIESATYIFKQAGETTKFIDGNRKFDFTYSGDLKYTTSSSELKHDGDDLIITNSETDEFIRLYHFTDLKNNRLQFDVELSNGKKFYSVVYNSNSQLVKEVNKCHDGPCREIDRHVINSLLEISQDDATGSCKDTVAACVRAGGKPSVNIIRGNGWFSAPESCIVSCN